jgi:twinkle protein
VKIVLAGDMDEAGRKMTEDIARRVGRERCARVTWPDGCKDANEVLVKIGPQAVKEAIESAEPFPTDGIIRVRDIMDDIFSLYADGLPRGISTGIPALDEHYTIKPGHWCATTGSPGAGKSNVLDQIMCNMAERDGARFGIASLENRYIARHTANILPKHLRKPFGEGKTERMTRDEVEYGALWMNDHFEFIQPEVPSLDEILRRAKALVFSSGITGLVIDPWNRLTHPPQGMNSGDYIARCLGQISDFAFNYGVYVWLVAHPTKLVKDSKGQYPCPTLYDISGSAHFYNMCDFGFAMWRDRKEYYNPIEFHIQKSRFQEIASESCVRIGYDPVTTRYFDLNATGEDEHENWKPKNFIDFAREREEAKYIEDERDMIANHEEEQFLSKFSDRGDDDLFSEPTAP